MMEALGLFGTFAMTELTLHPSFLMSIPIPNLIAWKMLPEKHFLHQYVCLSVYDSIPWGRGVLLLRYHLRWIDDVIMQWRIQGGGGEGSGAPLILRPKWCPKDRKTFLWDRALVSLSSPSPLYKGQDPPLSWKTVHCLFDWFQQMTNSDKFTFQGSLFSLLLWQIRGLLLKWKVRADCHPSLMDRQTLPQILARMRQQTETRMENLL